MRPCSAGSADQAVSLPSNAMHGVVAVGADQACHCRRRAISVRRWPEASNCAEPRLRLRGGNAPPPTSGVVTDAAQQRVEARAADEAVVAVESPEAVGAAAADERVVRPAPSGRPCSGCAPVPATSEAARWADRRSACRGLSRRTGCCARSRAMSLLSPIVTFSTSAPDAADQRVLRARDRAADQGLIPDARLRGAIGRRRSACRRPSRQPACCVPSPPTAHWRRTSPDSFHAPRRQSACRRRGPDR